MPHVSYNTITININDMSCKNRDTNIIWFTKQLLITQPIPLQRTYNPVKCGT